MVPPGPDCLSQCINQIVAARPPLNHDIHAIDAIGSMAWRCGLPLLDSVSTAAFSPRKDLVKNYRNAPDSLISTQVGLISDPVFVCYGVYMVLMSIASFNNPRIGANLIMFENITYFFSSQTAYFWLAIPCVMTMAPDPSALTYDAVTLTIGGLWVEVHMNYIYGHIAAWAPLENNEAPDKLGLLRAQQMFFVTAPLHTLAIFQGTQDSWKILFAAKDASRWASFDSINAITTAKLWVLTMMVMLSSSVVVGLVRIGTAKKPFDEIERWLGVVMSFVFLSLTAVPSAAMFFHKSVTKAKAKPSLMDRCTAGVFGKALVITPSLFYMFLYSAAIVVLLALRGGWRLDASGAACREGEGLCWSDAPRGWQLEPEDATARLVAVRIVPA